MKNPAFLLLTVLCTLTMRSLAQTRINDDYYGFSLVVPEEMYSFNEDPMDTIYYFSIDQWVPQATYEWRVKTDTAGIGTNTYFSVNAFRNRSITDIDQLVDFDIQSIQSRIRSIKEIPDQPYPTYEFVLYSETGDFAIRASYLIKNNVCIVLAFQADYPDFNTLLSLFDKLVGTLRLKKPIPDYGHLNLAIQEEPEASGLYFERAIRKYDFDELEEALEDCNTALQLDPEFHQALYLRGKVRLALGDTLSACEDLWGSMSEEFTAAEEYIYKYCAPEESEIFESVQRSESELLAAANRIKTHPGLLIEYREEPNTDELRMISEVMCLFELSQETLDSLFFHSEIIMQVYVFGVLCRNFPTHITEDHLSILESRQKVPMYRGEGKKPEYKKAGEIARNLYQLAEDQKAELIQQERTQKEVSQFILTYSRYPDSYIPGAFTEFHVMKTYDTKKKEVEKGSETYIITHSYSITDNTGRTRQFQHTFKLNHLFEMNIIEENETGIIKSFPPDLEEWLNLFGKDLNSSDRKTLHLGEQ